MPHVTPGALRLADAASAAQNPPMDATLKVLAASDHPASRGAAALIEAGYEDSTPLEALTPGSVTRTLAETFARELAKLYDSSGRSTTAHSSTPRPARASNSWSTPCADRAGRLGDGASSPSADHRPSGRRPGGRGL